MQILCEGGNCTTFLLTLHIGEFQTKKKKIGFALTKYFKVFGDLWEVDKKYFLFFYGIINFLCLHEFLKYYDVARWIDIINIFF